jgi:3-dehydroquinate dehydratase II
MKVLIINGPNLNMLGKRETSVYGANSLSDIERLVEVKAKGLGIEVGFFQSNHEGELIERVHKAGIEKMDGIVINPGGYTHTSIALRDALLAVNIPFVEVHISNVARREDFRHVSYFSDIAVGTVAGLGPIGYCLALEGLAEWKQG